MRAAIFRKLGPPSVLEYVQDWQKPARRSGEVLLKVQSSSVNPIDWKVRKGDLPKALVKLPKITGGDAAGVVEEADPNGKFKVGDKVFGCGPGNQPNNPWGAFADLYAVPESALELIPDNLSFDEAAAVPLVALTAWQALQPAMPLQGKRVLVHAGAGGVGNAAIQIAKAQGAHVTTTCSGRNVEFVTKELGADVAVDYTRERFEDAAKPELFDVVVDTIGGDYEPRSLSVLKRNGYFANILNSGLSNKHGPLLGATYMVLNTVKAKVKNVVRMGPRYSLIIMRPDANRGLQQVAQLIRDGKFKVFVDKRFPLEQAAAAHEYSETGHVRGKVVVQVVSGQQAGGAAAAGGAAVAGQTGAAGVSAPGAQAADAAAAGL